MKWFNINSIAFVLCGVAAISNLFIRGFGAWFFVLAILSIINGFMGFARAASKP